MNQEYSRYWWLAIVSIPVIALLLWLITNKERPASHVSTGARWRGRPP